MSKSVVQKSSNKIITKKIENLSDLTIIENSESKDSFAKGQSELTNDTKKVEDQKSFDFNSLNITENEIFPGLSADDLLEKLTKHLVESAVKNPSFVNSIFKNLLKGEKSLSDEKININEKHFTSTCLNSELETHQISTEIHNIGIYYSFQQIINENQNQVKSDESLSPKPDDDLIFVISEQKSIIENNKELECIEEVNELDSLQTGTEKKSLIHEDLNVPEIIQEIESECVESKIETKPRILKNKLFFFENEVSRSSDFNFKQESIQSSRKSRQKNQNSSIEKTKKCENFLKDHQKNQNINKNKNSRKRLSLFMGNNYSDFKAEKSSTINFSSICPFEANFDEKLKTSKIQKKRILSPYSKLIFPNSDLSKNEPKPSSSFQKNMNELTIEEDFSKNKDSIKSNINLYENLPCLNSFLKPSLAKFSRNSACFKSFAFKSEKEYIYPSREALFKTNNSNKVIKNAIHVKKGSDIIHISNFKQKSNKIHESPIFSFLQKSVHHKTEIFSKFNSKVKKNDRRSNDQTIESFKKDEFEGFNKTKCFRNQSPIKQTNVFSQLKSDKIMIHSNIKRKSFDNYFDHLKMKRWSNLTMLHSKPDQMKINSTQILENKQKSNSKTKKNSIANKNLN